MPPAWRIGAGELTQQTLLQRLDLCTSACLDSLQTTQTKSASHLQLLLLGSAADTVSESELAATWPKSVSTIKCYLFSQVTDPGIRQKLDEYVVAYSRMWVYGGLLTNLLAQRPHQQQPDEQGKDNISQLPPWTGQATAADEEMFDFLEDLSAHRQCFLPERWQLQVQAAAGGQAAKPRHPWIVELLEQQAPAADQAVAPTWGGMLSHLVPQGWRDIMCATGWDNALNHMHNTYRGNTQVHVTCHLTSAMQQYLGLVQLETPQDTPALRKLLQRMLTGRLEPVVMADSDFELLARLREVAGSASATAYLPKVAPWSPAVFSLHMFLQTVLPDGRSLLPVPTLSRHYAYMDEKILNSLLQGVASVKEIKRHLPGGGSLLQHVFATGLNTRRRALRKRLRRKAQSETQKQKKARKKWRRLGAGSLPSDAAVKSVETDGVGLCIHIERPDRWLQLPAPPKQPRRTRSRQPSQQPQQPPPVEVHGLEAAPVEYVALDTGRVNIFVAAHSEVSGC